MYAPIVAADTGLFESDKIIEITIEAPLSALASDRDLEPAYRDAKLTYQDEANVTHSLDVGVRPRGVTRRKPKVCKFPPLRLKFQSAQASGTIFEGQSKLKIVTHCRTTRKAYQQYVLQEYLAYKVLNLFTEHSFRVRLLKVNYVWTDDKHRPFSSYAFLIEDRDDMAARSGLSVQEPQRIEKHELEPAAANIAEIFQYLIGNTDWSFLGGRAGGDRCCHNVILIGPGDAVYIPVPYDFDFAGIVNTPYALPGPTTKIRNVRTRAYRGFCRPMDILETTLAQFREKRTAIYELYRQQTGFNKATRTRTLKYIDAFYKTIDDPRRLKRKINLACR